MPPTPSAVPAAATRRCAARRGWVGSGSRRGPAASAGVASAPSRRKRLVAVAGENDLVEVLDVPCGAEQRAGCVALHAQHRRVQACVGEAIDDAAAHSAASRRAPSSIAAGRSTCSRPWLWQKRISVATGKASICSLRARPDARDHRQQVPLPKLAAEAMLRRGTRRPTARASPHPRRRAMWVASRLKRAMSASMRQKPGRSRLRRCANTLRQAGAAPFDPVAARLYRERHVRRGGLHPQFGEQPHELRIGALVVDEETGVHAMRHAVERHVDRVRVAAEMPCGLEQRDPALAGCASQLARGSQAGNARADDGDSFHVRVRSGRCHAPRAPWAPESVERRAHHLGITTLSMT